jgi:hypothetical protein
MKKIITFLMMFLMTGGILMAQSFRYQAVLRDSQNHLVTEKQGTVTFNVGNVTWEAMPFTTNANGLVSLVLENKEGVDWSNATIKATFTFSNNQLPQIVVNTPVTAVPYALQAGDVKLTTDAIVRYLDNGDEDYMTDGWDWERIYAAMKENPAHNALRDSVVEYIKANKDLAKEIVISYIGLVSAQDLRDAYDSALNVSEEVKTAFYDNVKDYFMSHRQLIVDVAEYFILTATEDEITDVYNDLKNSPAAFEAQRILKRYFEAYLRNHGLICESGVTLCDVVTTLNAVSDCNYNPGTFSNKYQVVYEGSNFSVSFSGIDMSGYKVGFEVTYYNTNNQQVTYSKSNIEPNGNTYSVTLPDFQSPVSYKIFVGKPGCQSIQINY